MSNRVQNTKLESLGQALVETFPSASSVRVFARATNTVSMRETWSSVEDDFVGLDQERILGACQKRKRSVLIHDSSKDTLLRSVGVHHFASCLCVPVLDDSQKVVGAIYLTSSKIDAFTTQDKYTAEQISRGSARTITTMHTLSSEKGDNNGAGRLDFLYSPWTLGGVATLLFVSILFAISPGAAEFNLEPSRSSSNAANGTKPGPKEVARRFAQHLRVGEYGEAWQQLEPGLQHKWSREKFQRDLRIWAETESHQAILLARKLSDVRFRDKVVSTVFYSSSIEGDGGLWVWELRESAGNWSIVKIQGGPVESP